jgi:hypothetical protein
MVVRVRPDCHGAKLLSLPEQESTGRWASADGGEWRPSGSQWGFCASGARPEIQDTPVSDVAVGRQGLRGPSLKLL